MRRVIVNSTPLIVLCSVGKLDLLRKLYTEINIPQAVFDEVTEKPDSACQLLKESLDWGHKFRPIDCFDITKRNSVCSLCHGLDIRVPISHLPENFLFLHYFMPINHPGIYALLPLHHLHRPQT